MMLQNQAIGKHVSVSKNAPYAAKSSCVYSEISSSPLRHRISAEPGRDCTLGSLQPPKAPAAPSLPQASLSERSPDHPSRWLTTVSCYWVPAPACSHDLQITELACPLRGELSELLKTWTAAGSQEPQDVWLQNIQAWYWTSFTPGKESSTLYSCCYCNWLRAPPHPSPSYSTLVTAAIRCSLSYAHPSLHHPGCKVQTVLSIAACSSSLCFTPARPSPASQSRTIFFLCRNFTG